MPSKLQDTAEMNRVSEADFIGALTQISRDSVLLSCGYNYYIYCLNRRLCLKVDA